MKNKIDWNKLAKYAVIGVVAVLLLLWVVIPVAGIIAGHVGEFIISYIDNHLVGVSVVALIAGGICFVAWQTPQNTPPDSTKAMPKPTEEDYFKILKTIRPAVAEVASTLGLAPIDTRKDMAANEKERILQWGNVWGFKYKALKLSSTADIDVEQVRRVIQTQVATVLERDNPTKLVEKYYNYCGHLEPIIQIAEVKDDDAYIYIYAVMASGTYFKQVEQENDDRVSTLHTQADASDTDF